MISAEKAAKFFIMLANQGEDDSVTNMKLNKLLYYAQGVCLARTNRPLFDEQIEAWKLGPVVPSIYRIYKVCGSNPITYCDDDLKAQDFDSEDLETLLDVEREFGQFTGAKLVSMTHESNTPWSKAYYDGKQVIPQETIKEYFIENPVPRFNSKNKIEIVTQLPSNWYEPDEDQEWEAYL